MSPSPGTLLGHYKIHSALAAGGMGELFIAEDVEFERLVALKALHLEVSQDAERIRRFVLEAKATSALRSSRSYRGTGLFLVHVTCHC